MYQLRHYQAGATPAVAAYFAAHNWKRNPIVALPTGAGKSVCIADLIEWACTKKLNVLLLSHVQEILEQNIEKIETYTGRSVSVYAASMWRKEIGQITAASIQSAARKCELFAHFDLVIVDECHRISYDPESMFRRLLDVVDAPVVGFTATYYRLGTGYIFGKEEDHLFDDVVYDWTTPQKFVQLVDEGFLSPLTAEGTAYKMDTKEIKKVAGDFSLKELSKEFDRVGVTDSIMEELMVRGHDRKQWLIFAIDMKHADHIAEWLNRNGKKTIVVHSKMEEYGFDRNKVIADIKAFKYDAIVNVDILTTGFDHPAIDLIGILRPTESPVLHVQIGGRGSRVWDGKQDCLILDYAGNFERLGPINMPVIKVRGQSKGTGEPIMKECPACKLLVHAAVRFCPRCKHKFEFKHGLSATASHSRILEDGQPHWLDVDEVHYENKVGFGAPSVLVVIYRCGMLTVPQYICLEHKGFAKNKADHWVKFRGGIPTKNVAEFMPQTEQLKKPTRIRVERKGKYFNITDSIFE